MDNAKFLLVINFSLGLAYAAAFLALTWKSRIALGAWSAAGFLTASGTVFVEAMAGVIPSVRLTSALSFGSLMIALTAITAGLFRHYRPQTRIGPLFTLCVIAILFNALFVFDLPRGGWAQALAYQGPFAAMLMAACFATLAWSRRRGPDLALGTVLALSSAQFLVKIILAALAGAGPGVRDYITSSYAFYSQTAGGILSLLLGLALAGVIVRETMERLHLLFERDELSGVLNRSSFVARVNAILKSSARGPFILFLADLDRFKSINDRFGHAAGDDVIRSFGEILCAHFDDTALCGRLGGEEFCIMLTGHELDSSRQILDSVQAALRVKRHARLPPDVRVTVSWGIAVMAWGEPFDLALHRADMALYEAKAAGRDCYRFARAAGSKRREAPGADPFRMRALETPKHDPSLMTPPER
jgi:diguanylate cyclase (GGDEF)-like protein